MVDIHPSVTGGYDKFLESLRLTAKLQYLDCSQKLENAQKAVDLVGVKLEKNPLGGIGSLGKTINLVVQAEEALKNYNRTAKILTSLIPPTHGFISEDYN